MIELGDQIPNLTLSPRDDDRNPVDPGSVTLAITLPDNTVATPQVTKIAVGEYEAVYYGVQTGNHVAEWTATGAYAGTYRDSFYVEARTSIVSLADVKAHLRISRSTDDELLRLISLIASDACESGEGTNRRWRRRIVEGELHTAAPVIQLHNAPVISITEVRADGELVTDADYDLDPRTGLIYSLGSPLAASSRRFSTSWSYIAGTTAVPPLVREGVLEMCRHLYGNHRGGSGLPAQSEPDYTTSLAYLIPNRVAWAWQAYRMPG